MSLVFVTRAGIEIDVFLVVIDMDDRFCLPFPYLQSVENRAKVGHVILARIGHGSLLFCVTLWSYIGDLR